MVEKRVKCSKDDLGQCRAVASSQFGLATADQCFDDEGQFTDKTAEANLDNAVGNLNEFNKLFNYSLSFNIQTAFQSRLRLVQC